MRVKVSMNYWLSVLLLFLSFGVLNAQILLVEKSYAGEVAQGPSNQIPTLTLYELDGNKEILPDVLTQVSFVLSDMQVTSDGVEQVITFGSSARETLKWPKSEFVFQDMKSLGKPVSRLFTNSTEVGEGYSLQKAYGLWLFASIKHLSKSNRPKIGEREYLGNISIQFNRNVSDPIIHVSGLGALVQVEKIQRGFSVELDLITPTASLELLSGSPELYITPDRIANQADQMGGFCGSGAACGSIQVLGKDLQRIDFKVYLKRDIRENGYRGRWPLMRNMHSGDGFLMSCSFKESTNVSGKLQIRQQDQIISGNKLEQALMRVNIIDPLSNKVIASQPIQSDGTFLINGLTYQSVYGIQLSTAKSSPNETATASIIPHNWEVWQNADDPVKLDIKGGMFLFTPQRDQTNSFNFTAVDTRATTSGSQSLEDDITEINTVNDTQVIADELSIVDHKAEEDSKKDAEEWFESKEAMKEGKLSTVSKERAQKPIAQEVNSHKPNEKVPPRSSNEKCVIIVGSFVQGYNVSSMVATLQSDGWRVYEGDGPGKFVRIGIEVSCDQLQYTLEEAKVRYSKDAWILD